MDSYTLALGLLVLGVSIIFYLGWTRKVPK